jgi:adenylate kinase
MRLVFLGAPGAGKGTQAKRIAEKFNLAHISTGDILREEFKKNSRLGQEAGKYMQKGELVPDDLIIEIIKNILTENGSNSGVDFLMDGFPRTLNQAQKLDEMLESLGFSIDKVVNIDVGKDELVRRLSRRRVCNECNNICSVGSKEESDRDVDEEGKCPICGGKLFQRKDDHDEVIIQRLDVYENLTKPLEDYYRSKKLLKNIDGSGNEEDITERIISVL